MCETGVAMVVCLVVMFVLVVVMVGIVYGHVLNLGRVVVVGSGVGCLHALTLHLRALCGRSLEVMGSVGVEAWRGVDCALVVWRWLVVVVRWRLASAFGLAVSKGVKVEKATASGVEETGGFALGLSWF